MTRLYLWTVCAVALVGCHKEPVNVDLTKSTNEWFLVPEVTTNLSATNVWVGTNIEVFSTNIYEAGPYEVRFIIETNDPWMRVLSNTNRQIYYPEITTIEATHQPTPSHSNNVWIIRFEP